MLPTWVLVTDLHDRPACNHDNNNPARGSTVVQCGRLPFDTVPSSSLSICSSRHGVLLAQYSWLLSSTLSSILLMLLPLSDNTFFMLHTAAQLLSPHGQRRR